MLDALVTATKLDLVKRADKDGNVIVECQLNRGYMHNLTCALAAMWPTKDAGAFYQEALELDLTEKGSPENVRTGHFNG